VDSFGLLPSSTSFSSSFSNNNNNNNHNTNNNNNNNIKEETTLNKKAYEGRKKREGVVSNAEYYVTVDGTGGACTSSSPGDMHYCLYEWRSALKSILYVQSGNYLSVLYSQISFSYNGEYKLSGWMSDSGDGGSVISSDVTTYPVVGCYPYDFLSFYYSAVNIQYIYFIFLSDPPYFEDIFYSFFFFFYFILLIYNFIRLWGFSSNY
jgi:hypothetical protein